VRHRFATPGSHLVTLQAVPDAMPADDRQDYAVEVLPKLPVLLVAGDPDPAAPRRGADFLRDALAPARDPHPAILVRVVNVRNFDRAVLTRDIAGSGTNARVVVLCNIPQITPEQDSAIAAFLDNGGGVLIAPGDRTDADQFARAAYRAGRGWLPAQLAGPVGDLDDPAKAPRPQPTSFTHPALELFRDPQSGGLGDARFPRHWKLAVPVGGTARVAARLTDGDPFLVEKTVGEGRVLEACVSLDHSWGANLVELPAFAPLAHELVYYLAGGRSADLNVVPGQSVRYRVPKGGPMTGWVVQPPEGPERPAAVVDGQIAVGETGDAGVYVLCNSAGDLVRYFTVQPDPGESNLSASTDAERQRVRQAVPGLDFTADRAAVVADALRAPHPAELWWVCVAGVVGLLAAEVWLTRRRALAAGV
jgi:hypothetical protein